jgi:hypothetical protein
VQFAIIDIDRSSSRSGLTHRSRCAKRGGIVARFAPTSLRSSASSCTRNPDDDASDGGCNHNLACLSSCSTCTCGGSRSLLLKKTSTDRHERWSACPADHVQVLDAAMEEVPSTRSVAWLGLRPSCARYPQTPRFTRRHGQPFGRTIRARATLILLQSLRRHYDAHGVGADVISPTQPAW